MREAIARLAAAVPDPVLEVCRTLQDAGCEAWTVGGAVRDVILGNNPGDWDVATDAAPDRVQGLFDRTVPTGIEHGTVTVLVGPANAHLAVEVTSFRGEGAYGDARRPDSVTFGVSLDEDLSRRDFVINAIAFDPIARRLHDPFGGVVDIDKRRIRAVGAASARFLEDGLRVMRAVRFVSSLDFELDRDTEAGMSVALGSLARVAQERIRVELFKLLGGRAPRRALEIAERAGIVRVVLPEALGGGWSRALARVDACAPEVPLRVGALLAEIDPARVEEALRRLRASNTDRRRVVDMLAEFGAADHPPVDDTGVRRLLSRAGRGVVGDLVALWSAESRARGGDADLDALCQRAQAIADSGQALAIGELALSGDDVMRILGIGRSRRVGQVLGLALERVLERPELNEAGALAQLVPELSAQLDP